MEALPNEALLLITSTMDDRALRSFALVSRTFSAIIDGKTWALRLLQTYPHSKRWESIPAPSLAHLAAALERMDGCSDWAITRASGTTPPDRGGHAVATLPGGRGLVVHGGANGDVLHSDAYALLVGPYEAEASIGAPPAFRWCRLQLDGTDGAPSPRWAHSATALSEDLIVVFGGHGGYAEPSTVTCALDCSSSEPADWSWWPHGDTMSGAARLFVESGEKPASRYAHAACEHGGGSLWVFGGCTTGTCSNELFVATPRSTSGRLVLHWQPLAPQGARRRWLEPTAFSPCPALHSLLTSTSLIHAW